MQIHTSSIVTLDGLNFSRNGICWFDSLNDLSNLAHEMMTGYRVGAGFAVDGVKMTNDEAKRTAKSRELLRDWLFSFVLAPIKVKDEDGNIQTVHLASIREAWDLMFKNDKGKYIEAVYKRLSGCRREVASVIASACRLQMSKQVITDVPMIEHTGLSQEQVEQLARDENVRKNTGSRKLTDADMIFTLQKVYQIKGSQSALEKAGNLSHGTGQKVFTAFVIERRFPEYGMLSKLLTGALTLGNLDMTKLKSDVRDNGSLEQIKAVIEAKKEGNEKKMANKTDIVAGATVCPIDFGRGIFQAIIDDNLTSLGEVYMKAKEINVCVKAIMDGDPIILAAIAKIIKAKEDAEETAKAKAMAETLAMSPRVPAK
ncbi:MAG: hypothetical protein M0R80_13460 [Proteobacteria bacterium]|jgi:hypothetical protein|nr:hypothetical protein [Pseudomonadota bacterium]